jgi:hypothetical protein
MLAICFVVLLQLPECPQAHSTHHALEETEPPHGFLSLSCFDIFNCFGAHLSHMCDECYIDRLGIWQRLRENVFVVVDYFDVVIFSQGILLSVLFVLLGKHFREFVSEISMSPDEFGCLFVVFIVIVIADEHTFSVLIVGFHIFIFIRILPASHEESLNACNYVVVI